MDTNIFIATMTASLTLAGWLINHVLTGRREMTNQQLSASLTYVERQLEELYGPLAFLTIEGRNAAMDVVEALGREPVFGARENSLNEKEVTLWLFWVENDFLPRNERIQQLLMTKTHLVEGDKLPLSFVEYLHYHNSWRMSHLRWKQENIEYSWRSPASWPTSFSEEVLNTFKVLKIRHNKIARRIYT
jgi:hypothetical protein